MKKLLITGLIALGALVFAPAKAHAQTVADFNVPFSIDPGTGQGVQGASGSYHVVITQSGATYTVNVTGNNDGVGPSGPQGTFVPGAPTPKSGAGSLSFNFRTGLGALISATGVPGSANTTAYNGALPGVGSNLGGPNNVAFGTTGGAWTINNGFTLNFITSDENIYVAPRGGNTFTAQFTLAGGPIGSVSASFQDSGQQWTRTVVVTPEPATAAMALPGLLPMVPLALMALRRRRKVTSDVEAEEAEA